MENYIVRIYREADGENGQPFGIVERVNDSSKRAFRDSDELWAILNRSSCRRSSGAEQAEQENKAEFKRR